MPRHIKNVKSYLPKLEEKDPTSNMKKGRNHLRFVLYCVHPRSDLICAYADDGNIMQLNLNNSMYCFIRQETDVSIIKFFPRHDKIMIGFNNGLIKVVNTEIGEEFGIFKGHREKVRSISFNEFGKHCISLCCDRGYLWDPLTFQKLFCIESCENVNLREACFVPWNERFIVITNNNLLSIWNSRTGCSLKRFHALEILGYYINSYSFNRNGSIMIVGGNCNKLVSLCTSTWSLNKTYLLPCDIIRIKYIEFVPKLYDEGENSVVAILTPQNKIVLYDLVNYTILTLGPMDDDIIINFRVNYSGSHFICLVGNGTLRIFNNEIWKKKQSRNDLQYTHVTEEFSSKILDSACLGFQVTKQDLKILINSYGKFPDDIRPFLWQNVLSLPMNIHAYRNLCNKGLHAAFKNIQDYPFLPTQLCLPVLRLASNLANWCSLFVQIKYLPLMVLRFAKIFKSSPITAFEVIATIVVNYCQHWFIDIPLSPNGVTKLIETIIETLDLELWEHFNKVEIKLSTFVWSILETLFAEVLNESDWLVFWDNVFTFESDYVTVAIAVFILVNRNLFLSCKSKDQFEFLIHNPVNINIMLFIKRIRQVSNTFNFKMMFKEFKPLLKGDTYQSFLSYQNELSDWFSNLIIARLNLVKIKEMETNSVTEEIRSTGVFITCYESETTPKISFMSNQLRPYSSTSCESDQVGPSQLNEDESRDFEKVIDLKKQAYIVRVTHLEALKNALLINKNWKYC